VKACGFCLRELRSALAYHPRCARMLFGSSRVPTIDVQLAKLHTFAQAMVGHTSISGVQQKVSLGFEVGRTRLSVVAEGGEFILKPQQSAYPFMPENEQVTMRLAALFGIDTPPCGLVRLSDDSVGYLVRRFDRPGQGRKRHQEDFCQLAELYPGQKYEGSAELCVRLLRRFVSEPLVEIRKLYQRLVFVWWVGNGDAHLKNFSLLESDEGLWRLSPAYDLVSTRLVLPEDPLALAVQGKRDRLTRKDWLRFAKYCALPEPVAQDVLAGCRRVLPEAAATLARSPLPADAKVAYARLLQTRAQALSA
jgi:serine/threonine-protein kinase HipA